MHCTEATALFSHPANSQAQQVSTAAAVQSTVRESVGSAAGRSSLARAALVARRRAATWHAVGAVSDPNNSLERQEGWRRPCWGRAISRVRGSLREQRGEGCLALCELHVPCAAGRPRPAGQLLAWQGCTLLTHSTRPTARPHTMVHLEIRFPSGPSCAASLQAPRARATHARWAAGPLQCKFTYYYSAVAGRWGGNSIAYAHYGVTVTDP